MLWILITSLLWGVTTPFLRQGTQGLHDSELKNQSLLKQFLWLLCQPNYVVPYGLNFIGSITFQYSLHTAPLSLVSPFVNALSFLWTWCISWAWFHELNLTKTSFLGIVCVLSGITLCFMESN